MLQQLFIIVALGVVLSFFNTPVFAETYDEDEEETLATSEDEWEDEEAADEPISEKNTRKKIPWRFSRIPMRDKDSSQADEGPITVNNDAKIDTSTGFINGKAENPSSKEGLKEANPKKEQSQNEQNPKSSELTYTQSKESLIKDKEKDPNLSTRNESQNTKENSYNSDALEEDAYEEDDEYEEEN